jgi:IrrE N-terminal-like domain
VSLLSSFRSSKVAKKAYSELLLAHTQQQLEKLFAYEQGEKKLLDSEYVFTKPQTLLYGTAQQWALAGRAYFTSFDGQQPLIEYSQTFSEDYGSHKLAFRQLLGLANSRTLAVIYNGHNVASRKVKVDEYVQQLAALDNAEAMSIDGKVIVMHSLAHAGQEVRVLVHEIAHHLLGHTQADTIGQRKLEIQAELLAYLLLVRIGIHQEAVHLEYCKQYGPIDDWQDIWQEAHAKAVQELACFDKLMGVTDAHQLTTT